MNSHPLFFFPLHDLMLPVFVRFLLRVTIAFLPFCLCRLFLIFPSLQSPTR